MTFEFGVYIGGAAGTETGMTSGPPDDSKYILNALRELQGNASSFLVRCYAGYQGKEKEPRHLPAETQEYVTPRRKLDLVLYFHSEESDMEGWKAFITAYIKVHGKHIRYLQITEEANVNLPSLDGYYPHSRRALVEGIVHAKQIIKELDLSIEVGFNATPDFNPNKTFWKEIKALATREFYEALDYVGIDFFPGVFRALPSEKRADVEQMIGGIISAFRNDIADAGIRPDISLHVTENGYSTSPGAMEKKQSEMISIIVGSVFNLRRQYNIRTYELFSLRDADSSVDDIFYQFGIMRNDYSPKQGFFTYKDLIANYSG